MHSRIVPVLARSDKCPFHHLAAFNMAPCMRGYLRRRHPCLKKRSSDVANLCFCQCLGLSSAQRNPRYPGRHPPLACMAARRFALPKYRALSYSCIRTATYSPDKLGTDAADDAPRCLAELGLAAGARNAETVLVGKMITHGHRLL